ncbi:MAG: CotH kinase family protein [Bacteroidota bacterium]
MKRILLLIIFLLTLSESLFAYIRLNELMAINITTKRDPDKSAYVDWVEIYNSGNETVSLEDYFLTDNQAETYKWRFPAGVKLDPNKYLLVWMDGTGINANGIHATFGLDGMGEWLAITDLSGRVVDSVRYGRQVANHSYGRSRSSQSWYYMSKSSPGAVNDDAYDYLITPPPILSRESEINGQYFSLTVTPSIEGAVIYYTLDGSEPDENSSLYSGPVSITKNTVFRAVQAAEGYSKHWIASATFLFNITTSLPVISLISDPENLWDDYKGIYVTGLNGITGYCSDVPRNYNQDWERPVTFEYFDRDHQLAVNQDAGMKIFGGCSRGQSLKSLNISADKIYGKNRFNYAFFREKPGMDEVKTIVLRNSGNDFSYTMMRDPMMQALVKEDMQIDGQAYEPAVVYLNGEYWGIHNMREKISDNYIESNYGIPSENVNLLEGYNSVISGSASTYNQLYSYISTNDLSLPANYEYVTQRMDIREYISYMWAQIYFGNTDWPGNNIKFWNTRESGSKWRWILYDTDFGFNLYNAPPNHNTLEFALYEFGTGWPNPSWSTLIFRKLMHNSDFAAAFLAEAQTRLLTTFNSDRVISVIDSIAAGISADMPAHIARWGSPGSMANWQYNVQYLRDFATQRPSYLVQFLGEHYGIGTSYGLDISFPASQGVVWMNGVQLNKPVSGGSLLNGTLVKLDAQAKPGYRFSEWKVTTSRIDVIKLANSGSIWKYSDNGIRPAGWEQPGFDDSGWASGTPELGYGDGDEATLTGYGSDAGAKYITTYFRYTFNVDDPASLDSLSLGYVRDDGIVIYLNGSELIRDNMPAGNIDNNTLASTGLGGSDESAWHYLELSPDQLLAGSNTLAAEIHQSGSTSSDISFNLSLTGWVFYGTSTFSETSRPLDLTVSDNLSVEAVFEVNDLVPDLKINELMAGNKSYITDDFGEYDDWIELLSRESEPVDLAGMYLSDRKDNLTAWMIPFGTPASVIQPGSYKILWADGQPLQGPLHLDFKLSAGGETLLLSMYHNGVLTVIDSLSYAAMNDDVSWGLYQDGWVWCAEPTPGEENSTPYIMSVEAELIEPLIYPNPATEEFFIRFEGSGISEFTVMVFDLQGREVLHQEVPDAFAGETRIDVSNLHSGMYLVTVKEENRLYTHKLLISR